MDPTSEEKLRSDLRAAYGRSLPGAEFDRRVLDRIDLDDGETELSVPEPGRARFWPWVVGAAAVLLFLVGAPVAWFASQDEEPAVPPGAANPYEFTLAGPGEPAPLPKVPVQAAKVELKSDYLVVNMKKDGRLVVKGRTYTVEKLAEMLKAEASAAPKEMREDGQWVSEVRVIVRADKEVRWERVQEVMQACSDPAVRIYKIQFVTVDETAESDDRDGEHFPVPPPDDPVQVPDPDSDADVEEREMELVLPDGTKRLVTVRKHGEFPKLPVELKRRKDETKTHVIFRDRELGAGEAGFLALDKALAGLPDFMKEFSPAEINAWALVPHADVVRTIDAFMAVGITNITFVGAPPPEEKAPPEDLQPEPDRDGYLRICLFLKDGKTLASFGKDRVVYDLDEALRHLDRLLAAHIAAGKAKKGLIEAGVYISQLDFDRIMAVFRKHGVTDVVVIR